MFKKLGKLSELQWGKTENKKYFLFSRNNEVSFPAGLCPVSFASSCLSGCTLHAHVLSDFSNSLFLYSPHAYRSATHLLEPWGLLDNTRGFFSCILLKQLKLL